jgi:hypothetical protein
MPNKKGPDESDSVLSVEWLHFPVNITEGVLEQSCNILECSPLLSHISGLSSCENELREITISLLSKSSIRRESLGIKDR